MTKRSIACVIVPLAAAVLGACSAEVPVTSPSPATANKIVRDDPTLLNGRGIQVRPIASELPTVSKLGDAVGCSSLARTIQVIGGNPVSTGDIGTRTYPTGGYDIMFGPDLNREDGALIVNGKEWTRIPSAADADYAIISPADWEGGRVLTVVACVRKHAAQ